MPKFFILRLDNVELGSGNVEGVGVGGEADESLLAAVGARYCQTELSQRLRFGLPDQGVDLDGVNVVELLEGLLDLALVGLGVDDEDKGVVLLNLLHGALGVERVDDDLAGIEARLGWNRLARVLRRTREREGLWEVEGRALADLGNLVRVDLL